MTKDDFYAYDEGAQKNKEKYGQDHPPLIDLRNIRSIPIAMFVG
jgi:hypothetical protein